MAYINDVPLPVVVERTSPVASCLANDNCCISESQLLVIAAYLLSGQLQESGTPMEARAAIQLLGLSGAPYTRRYLLMVMLCSLLDRLDNTSSLNDLWIAAQAANWNAISDYERQLIITEAISILLTS